MKRDLTLQRVKNTSFPNIYKEFILNMGLNEIDYNCLLSLAIIFINSENKDIQRLGYRMIVIYCNQTRSYHPLYEIAINMGLFPVSKFIAMQNITHNTSVFFELNESFTSNYLENEKYQSFAQKSLNNFFNENIDISTAIVAPTSYGKTDLIMSLLKKCINKNICIITPTKSLLAQTKMRIANSNIQWINKIITHPEMYNEKDRYIVAVLTQERLLRLLRKDPKLTFDYVIIDEAHSLLTNDTRNILLASIVIILEKRNIKTVFKFLTPFLNEGSNIDIKGVKFKKQEHYVNEYIKTERFYLYNLNKRKLEFYDQFMDQFYLINENINFDEATFIENYQAEKNIVYLNKPIDIEDFADKLSKKRSLIDSAKITKACNDIAEYIHPQYSLIKYLQKGIIYHHGSVPDSIRLYIEYLYSNEPEIKHVITSSTLLEGVNLPAERMFILDNKKGRRALSPSNFKNLIGRVCRFGDIFNENNSDLHKLEPHIYLIKGTYCSVNADLNGFLSKTSKVDRRINDEPQNILLKATDVNDENKKEYENAIEFIENYENDTIEKYNLRYVETEAGKACFVNNITELPIFQVEKTLQLHTERLRKEELIINNSDTLMNAINELFFRHVLLDEQDINSQSIWRFKNESARKFYSMFLNWRIKGASYSEMIRSFLVYWEELIKRNEDEEILVFVGRWGDTPRGGYQTLWTDIKGKSISQRINLAIVRIKEEQDFLDNVIIKYIEVLNDLGFMEEPFYNKIKYGTDDIRIIALVKNGFSLSLSNLLVDKYLTFLLIDYINSIVIFKTGLIDDMILNDENQILINEAKYYAIY